VINGCSNPHESITFDLQIKENQDFNNVNIKKLRENKENQVNRKLPQVFHDKESR
jgi:hypothetical protein